MVWWTKYLTMQLVYLGAVLLLAATTRGAYSPFGPTEPSSYNVPHVNNGNRQRNQHQTPQNNGLHNAPQPKAPPQDFIEFKIPVDLTHPLDSEAQAWLNTTAFIHENEKADEERGFFYANQDIRLGEHVGTHMDAPYHFNKDGIKIGYISVTKLIAKAIILDGETRRNATVGIQHLKAWLKKNGPLPNPCVVLIRFNWAQYYSQREQYFAYSNGRPYEFEFPGITPELADKLAQLEEVVGVGIDTPSIDPGQSRDFQAHRTLAKANKYVLENVLLPPKLPPKGWTVLAMPIRLTMGTGAPCRVVAIPNGYNSATSSSVAVSIIVVTALSSFGRVLIT